MLWPAGELERGGVFGIGRRAQLCCILLEVIMRWLAAGLCLFFARFSLQKGEKTA